MTRVILTLLISFALTACGGFNGREDALFDSRYQHPISVDPQVVTLQMDVPQDKVALSLADKAALDAFARTYKARGHGAMTIAAPSGSPNEAAAVSIVAETRAVLAEAGLSGAAVGYAAYRASSANSNAPVILTYRRFVASASPCGNWTQDYAFAPNNERTPNFGCSTQSNLAAIVADPADLMGPRDWDPAFAPRRDEVIENFRVGEVTEAAESGNASGSVSEVAE
ncbi:MAG: CpaD family pilus assembly lipoprotein [Rhodobiaceae bacterium]|nr:CpaD family pilus assembly lipoprotein [Rhodobiaceae bacterium]